MAEDFIKFLSSSNNLKMTMIPNSEVSINMDITKTVAEIIIDRFKNDFKDVEKLIEDYEKRNIPLWGLYNRLLHDKLNLCSPY